MFTMIKLMREANKTVQEGLIGNPPNRIYTGIVFLSFGIGLVLSGAAQIKVESIGGQNGTVSK